MRTTHQFMSNHPITVRDTAPISEAHALMSVHGFRHLPVLDAQGDTVGILSDRDVQRAMSVRRTGALGQEISFNPNYRVEDFMSWPVCVVSEETPLRMVAEQMLKQKLSAMIVVNSQAELTGIITTDDILAAFLETEGKETERAVRNWSGLFQRRMGFRPSLDMP